VHRAEIEKQVGKVQSVEAALAAAQAQAQALCEAAEEQHQEVSAAEEKQAAKVQSLQVALTAALAEAHLLLETAEEREREVKATGEKLAEVTRHNQELSLEVEAMQRSLHEGKQRELQQEADMSNLRNQLNAIQQELAAAKEGISVEPKRTSLTAGAAETPENLRMLDEARTQVSALEARLSEALTEVSSLEERVESLNALKLQHESLSAEHHRQLAKYDGQLAEARAQLEDTLRQLEDTRLTVVMLMTEVAKRDTQMELCGRSQLLDLADQRAQLGPHSVMELTKQLEKQKEITLQAQEAVKSLEAEKTAVYQELEQCRSDLQESRHRMEQMERNSVGDIWQVMQLGAPLEEQARASNERREAMADASEPLAGGADTNASKPLAGGADTNAAPRRSVEDRSSASISSLQIRRADDGDHIQARLAELEEELQAAHARLEQQQRELQAAQPEVEKLSALERGLEGKCAKAQACTTEVDAEHARAVAELQAQLEQVAVLEAENRALTESNIRMVEKLSALERDLERRRSEAKARLEHVTEVDAEHAQMVGKLQAQVKQVAALEAQNRALAESNKNMADRLMAEDGQLQRLRDELATSEQRRRRWRRVALRPSGTSAVEAASTSSAGGGGGDAGEARKEAARGSAPRGADAVRRRSGWRPSRLAGVYPERLPTVSEDSPPKTPPPPPPPPPPPHNTPVQYRR